MSAAPNILVLCPVKEHHRALLAQMLPSGIFTYCSPEEVAISQLAEAEMIFGNPNPDTLKQATKLRFLQLNSAGADAYTAPGVLPAGVVLANATGSYGLAMAEHLLGTLLMLTKKLHLYRDQQPQAKWEPRGEVLPIWGSTVLIIGLGDIGGEFALRMKGMGAKVIGVRRRGTDKPDYVDELYLADQINSLLPLADTVALCLPNTAETRGLMSRERISLMKRDAILLNVGRGTAVDAEALCDALDSGHLWGAALDVTDPEPLPAKSRLWHTQNLLITPHVSGGYSLPETHNRIIRLGAANLKAFLEGASIQNAVDFETGYRKL